MKSHFKILLPLTALILTSVIVVFLIFRNQPLQPYFVDTGRYADIGRSLITHGTFTNYFTFPGSFTPTPTGYLINLPPVQGFLLAASFVLFGINDTAVIYSSVFFYICLVLSTYLLSLRYFSPLTSFASGLSVALLPQTYSHARDGATEPVFTFLILLISLAISVKKPWALISAGLLSGLLIFTKLQAYFYLPVFIIWILLLYKFKLKPLALFVIPALVLFVLNYLKILFPFYRNGLPAYVVLSHTSAFPSDNLPRSQQVGHISLADIFASLKSVSSKVFYNIYNFYKSFLFLEPNLPSIAPAPLLVTYFISLTKVKPRSLSPETIFKVVTLLLFLSTLLLASISSPQIRYLHPILPFLTICTFDYLEQLFSKLTFKQRQIKIIVSLFILLTLILPFLGKTIIDQRFTENISNTDKPYAQSLIGEKLKSLTDPSAVVITNLDTWGSWYGERQTILIPLRPADLTDIDTRQKISHIYLTDYQRYNENHPLNDEWGKVFDQAILAGYNLERIGTVSAQENFENQKYTYKLWVKK